MRNIMVIVGSGTEGGNTDRLADSFCGGALEAGHTVHKVFLGGKELRGCTGCGVCRTGNGCIVGDAMQAIYPLFEQCDTLALASPLYFWTITASVKAFIERLYAVSGKDGYPPKDSLLLMTAGDDEFWTFEQPVSYYRFLTKALGWTDLGMCLAGGCSGRPGKRHIAEQHLQNAYELGNTLDKGVR